MSEGSSKIYTKGGDKGKTSLIGGTRVSKSDLRLEAYGTVDELNSMIGLLHANLQEDLADESAELARISAELILLQRDLFNVGSQLACEDPKVRTTLPSITDIEVLSLEKSMDEFSRALTPLKHFILPGGARSACNAHLARTICRRAERLTVRLGDTADGEVDQIVVQFLNRLSDYFFVLARHINRLLGVVEPIWEGKKKA